MTCSAIETPAVPSQVETPRESIFRVALIPGDGIGQEIMESASEVLHLLFPTADSTSPESPVLELIEARAGLQAFFDTGKALPDATLDLLKTCHGALFGAVSSPSEFLDGYKSPIVTMRRAMDLYANLRPLISAPIPGVKPDIDILLVRENTEGLYCGRERWVDSDGEHESDETQSAVAERWISRKASERIAVTAFEAARQRIRQGHPGCVTVAHKANVLRLTDGLFRTTVLDVASRFPDVEVEEQLVDSLLYRLIQEPERYDVIVAPNLYGDMLADAGAALVGGLGLVPSANSGYLDGRPWTLAEPVHGSAPDIAGQGIANPVAMLYATALLLESTGFETAGHRLRRAIRQTLEHGPKTPDLGGHSSTREVTQAVIERLGDSEAHLFETTPASWSMSLL